MSDRRSKVFEEHPFEGVEFEPVIIVESMSSPDVAVLSDGDSDVPASKPVRKARKAVVISSESDEETGSSLLSSRKKQNKGKNGTKNKKDSDESDYDDASDEPSVKSASDEDDSSKSPTPPSRSVSGTPRRRKRIASASSLSSISSGESSSESDASEVVVRKTRASKRKPADDDSDVEYDKTVKKKTKRIRIDTDDENSLSAEDGNGDTATQKKRRRTRKLMTREELAQDTIDAENAEKERRARLEQRQKEFNGIEFVSTDGDTDAIKQLKSIVVDNDASNEKPNPVKVHADLVKLALPHQADGIKFMYDNVVESLEMFRKDNNGGGCILAHCMGLGKTFTTIAFIHTVLTHSELKVDISKVLVVVPKNVVLNWKNEFDKWLLENGRYLDDFYVYELDSFKSEGERLSCLRNWHKSKQPAVMIIGYDLFRILTQCPEDQVKKNKKNAPKPKKLTRKQKHFVELQKDFRKYLHDPGPDLVICDEGHKLKNDDSILSKTMMKIRTRRRICLTGTPLQNNLIEYHVMVSFVKPGLLGTKTEFSNRFANPINRGRTKDASGMEVSFMKRRCHVLYERLKNVVQRKEISVLKTELPEKQEFVVYVRMTTAQITLYELFLTRVDKEGGLKMRKKLLPDYHVFSRIWTHPYLLISHQRELERKAILTEDKEDLDGFVVDSDEESSAGDADSGDDEPRREPRKSRRLAGDEVDDRPLTPLSCRGWFTDSGVVTEDSEFDLTMGNKLVLLIEIIKKCESIGDKLLVFSQSLESLHMIKRFLEYFDENGLWFADGHECLAAKGETWGWKQNRDYLVIDGSVGIHDREYLQNTFNNKKKLRERLMLISTRAGGLGINLTAANRVVIFDACWNPSHDTQSLFRVYRIGQTKPCYIYRFIGQGTMEERIYKRQVTKESTALRVVDEYQIQRHFDGHDLEELYRFDPLPYVGTHNMMPPRDKLLGDIILTHPECVVDYIVHDTLFENQEDEKLTTEECAAAWEDYENEKSGRHTIALPTGNGTTANLNIDELRALLASTIANFPNQPAANSNVVMGPRNFDPEVEPAIGVDPVYLVSKIKRFGEFQCRRLAYIKLILDKCLSKSPRREIAEFGTSFDNMIIQKNTSGDAALLSAIKFFDLSIKIFQKEGSAEVKRYIEYLRKVSPWMFNVATNSAPAQVIELQ